MTSHRFVGVLASIVLGACGACGPEITSFRSLDKGDGSHRAGPPSAAYDVRMADLPVADVHVWSNGGYISIDEEPMTHIGFEIHNTSARSIVFEDNAVELTVLDNTTSALPPTRIASIEPVGPAQRSIRSGATIMLGGYFVLPVRPRAVAAMQVRWALRAGGQRYLQVTRFTRDDDDPVVDAPDGIEARRVKP
jgi:hypothetical protein